ncbi:hypothetical protein VTN96DRAFT_6174 [Rasamsonia emersonii]
MKSSGLDMAASVSMRRNRSSEVELCYVSPSIDTPGAVVSAPFVAPDDSGVELSDGLVDEDLRTGGPYLCAIPTRSVPIPKYHPLQPRLEDRDARLLKTINSILQSHDVDFQSIDLCGRRSEFDPEPDLVPTVLVLAKRHALDKNWLEACREIRTFLINENLSSVSVEIADLRAFEPLQYSPVLPTDTIYYIWDKVLDRILTQLDLAEIKCVECFRMGTSDNHNENPPTVILTVAKQSTKDWRPVREDIIGIVDSFHLPTVGVSIGPGDIVRQNGVSVAYPLNAYQDGAQAGLSLGIHGSMLSAGTFAGWVQLKNPRTGEWEKFGLTCFHCVDPGTNSISTTDLTQLQDWHKNGISPNDQSARRLLQLDQPCLKDIKRDLNMLQEQIKTVSEDGEFIHVKTAVESGNFVTPRDKRRDENDSAILDWALISVQPSRALSDNTILGYGTPPPSMSLLPDLKLENFTKPPCRHFSIEILWCGASTMEKLEEASGLLRSEPYNQVYVPQPPDPVVQPYSLYHTFPRFKLKGVDLKFLLIPSEDCHLDCDPSQMERSSVSKS